VGWTLEHFADRWESNTRAIKTWLGTGDLRKVILEIYKPANDKLVTRWHIALVYGWSDATALLNDTSSDIAIRSWLVPRSKYNHA